MKIFLAPRSNETSYKNFLSTIESGVDYSIVEPHLDEEGKKMLNGEKKVFVWGNRETKISSWEKMEPNDLILFYKGREGEEREGKLIFAGRLLYKQHSKELGLSLWPPKKGEEPWTCIFFLKDLHPVYVPISEIADMSGYSRNFVVQGFMPLSDEGVNNILTKFGTVDKFLNNYKLKEKTYESDLEESEKIQAHAEAELYLLKIGRMLGYDTYCPDKSSKAFDEILSEYINLNEVPRTFIGDDIYKLVKEIDVIWFKDRVPKFAFEVEHSTGVEKGLQRLCQLIPLSAKLFIVASINAFYLFEKYMETDPYFKYKEEIKFRNYKQLEHYFKSVSEFSAINDAFLK